VSVRATVTVLGLGSIGATFAQALKGTGRFAQVVAWDPDFDLARQGQKEGVADRFAGRAPEAVRQSAAVFLALPPDTMRDTLVAISPHLSAGAVVCSLDEGQERATALATELLPGNVSFVAAHPILWERLGLDGPRGADALRQGVLSIAASPSAHPDAVAYLTSLAETLQMGPFFVDAREHDAFATGVGRLPSVLAAAYVRVAAREGSWRELGRIAGGEFRQLGTLVDFDPSEGQQGLTATREHLVRWLDALMGELQTLRDGLQDGQEPEDYYTVARVAWREWLQKRQLPPEAADLPPPPPVARRRFPF
jgi:prephenate dehydrogenase